MHIAKFQDLPPETAGEIHTLSGHAIEILESQYGAQGFNLGINLGRAGGAGMPDHLHFHVVPRWEGDTNFMPVIAEIKTLPEHLMKSYDDLVRHFRKKEV